MTFFWTEIDQNKSGLVPLCASHSVSVSASSDVDLKFKLLSGLQKSTKINSFKKLAKIGLYLHCVWWQDSFSQEILDKNLRKFVFVYILDRELTNFDKFIGGKSVKIKLCLHLDRELINFDKFIGWKSVKIELCLHFGSWTD